ncbi:MAG TPA: aldehyde dehydrogenase family protein, partial [Thermoleophilaceae bacterium]|nr:aldehyde dehydrogenase family protein [Thermoleophilaceae bacterium]
MTSARDPQERPADGSLDSFNPATGERIGSVPTIAPGQVQSVVDEVAEVQPFWAELPLADRGRYMRRTAQVLIDNLDALASLIAREQGRPVVECHTAELLPTIDALHWIAEEGPGILGGERVPHPQVPLRPKRGRLRYEPLGVVGVIAPWNHPWSSPLGEVATALMCGNGVVLKPASQTALVGQQIQWAFERAGLPEGLVRCIHGGEAVGRAVVEASVQKVLFTGSMEVGREVGAGCGERVKGAVLELGGKDPAIVLADADLEMTVAGCAWGAFTNAGQSASSIERIYVMREVADHFVEALVARARALRLGDPLEGSTEIGPIASGERFEALRELVDDAVSAGAELRCGGPTEVEGLDGRFYAPTVLTGVRDDMRIMREQILGPVTTVIAVDSEEEAIRCANTTEFGLGASVWTLDRERAERIAARIAAGSVWINDHSYSRGAFQCPWGGEKSSGVGRSHSRFGFYECV